MLCINLADITEQVSGQLAILVDALGLLVCVGVDVGVSVRVLVGVDDSVGVWVSWVAVGLRVPFGFEVSICRGGTSLAVGEGALASGVAICPQPFKKKLMVSSKKAATYLFLIKFLRRGGSDCTSYNKCL